MHTKLIRPLSIIVVSAMLVATLPLASAFAAPAPAAAPTAAPVPAPAAATTSAGDTSAQLASLPATCQNHAMLWGVDLIGMTEASATAAVKSAWGGRAWIGILHNRTRYKFNPRAVVTLNVPVTVARAFVSRPTSAPFDIAPRYWVDKGKVQRWVGDVARAINKPMINAGYWVNYAIYDGSALQCRAEQTGVELYSYRCTDTLMRVIANEMATGKAPSTPVVFTDALYKPTITMASLPKAIFVRLDWKMLWLYNHKVLEDTRHIAVGQPEYPTPTGVWHIIRKVMNPDWTNPGSDWAKSMPSYIPPGPNNPLGLRALYLDASGIRIHGTTNIGSIGTPASHGCMRMANSEIVDFYPKVPVGTVVYIIP